MSVGAGLRKEDIERIELERRRYADGSVWEKMTIFFREKRNPEDMCHRICSDTRGRSGCTIRLGPCG
jgi:hypothetical protein